MGLFDGFDPQDFADRGGLLGRLLSLRPDLAESQQTSQFVQGQTAPAPAQPKWPSSPRSAGLMQPLQFAQAQPGVFQIDPLIPSRPGWPIAGDELPPGLIAGGGLLGLGLGALILNNKKNPEGPGEQGDVDEKSASTPVGRRGDELNVIPGTNEPVTIGSRNYIGHAVDQMQARGIPPTAVEDAIQSGVATPGNTPDRTLHVGVDGLKVVTDSDGQVITVIPGKSR